MVPRVLVITPHAAFGELFRQSLEQNGDYIVQVCPNAAQALAQAQKTQFAVAILDSDIADQPFVTTGQALISRHPGLRLVLLPPGNDPNHAAINGLKPHAFLDKPFYLPEMLQVVDEQARQFEPVATPRPPRPQAEKITSAPAEWQIVSGACVWAAGSGEAAGELAQLALDPAAEAGLIVEQGELCLFAGLLPRPAAEELANHLSLYWNSAGGEDLTRFVRLKANAGKQSMLYATALSPTTVLALVYAETTPFSHIRGQALKMARALSALAPASTPGASEAETETGWVREVDQAPLADVTETAAGFTHPLQPPQRVEEALFPSRQSDLAYTCALTPRDPARLLTGALAGQLNDCLKSIFEAQGWLLERVAVHDHTLEWVARIPPQIAPQTMAQLVRAQTAERVVAASEDALDGGDHFWAAMYLITGGSRHLSAKMLHAFAEEARKEP